MGASSDWRSRRRREKVGMPTGLTPKEEMLLETIGNYGILTTPQLSRLTGLSEKSVRRGALGLAREGLAEAVRVSRATLTEGAGWGAGSYPFGTSPNIYRLTRDGRELLQSAKGNGRSLYSIGLPSPLLLRHALAVTDFRIWLERCAKGNPVHHLEVWRQGGEAQIDLRRPVPPKVVRPDAWFVYRLGTSVLVGLVEVDRGTERGNLRWAEKVAAYQTLFDSGRLPVVTGYLNARVLVITSNERRRERLRQFLEGKGELSKRFWLAERSILETGDFGSAVWVQPNNPDLHPLLPPEMPGKGRDVPGESSA